jgi:hypothetical protein
MTNSAILCPACGAIRKQGDLCHCGHQTQRPLRPCRGCQGCECRVPDVQTLASYCTAHGVRLRIPDLCIGVNTDRTPNWCPHLGRVTPREVVRDGCLVVEGEEK